MNVPVDNVPSVASPDRRGKYRPTGGQGDHQITLGLVDPDVLVAALLNGDRDALAIGRHPGRSKISAGLGQEWLLFACRIEPLHGGAGIINAPPVHEGARARHVVLRATKTGSYATSSRTVTAVPRVSIRSRSNGTATIVAFLMYTRWPLAK